MADAATASLAEALSQLIPLVGVGGITAMVVAYFGMRRRPDVATSPLNQTAGFQALLADHVSMERFTGEIRRLASANERIANGVERHCDLMDITQAMDRLPRPPRRRRRRPDGGE